MEDEHHYIGVGWNHRDLYAFLKQTLDDCHGRTLALKPKAKAASIDCEGETVV